MEIITLDKTNFDNIVFAKDKTVLIDFYADWCVPCKMLSPIIEDFSKSTNKNIVIGKLNVDNNQELAMKFNIYSIPALMLVKDGKVLKVEPGFKTKDALEQFTNV